LQKKIGNREFFTCFISIKQLANERIFKLLSESSRLIFLSLKINVQRRKNTELLFEKLKKVKNAVI